MIWRTYLRRHPDGRLRKIALIIAPGAAQVNEVNAGGELLHHGKQVIIGSTPKEPVQKHGRWRSCQLPEGCVLPDWLCSRSGATRMGTEVVG